MPHPPGYLPPGHASLPAPGSAPRGHGCDAHPRLTRNHRSWSGRRAPRVRRGTRPPQMDYRRRSTKPFPQHAARSLHIPRFLFPAFPRHAPSHRPKLGCSNSRSWSHPAHPSRGRPRFAPDSRIASPRKPPAGGNTRRRAAYIWHTLLPCQRRFSANDTGLRVRYHAGLDRVLERFRRSARG